MQFLVLLTSVSNKSLRGYVRILAEVSLRNMKCIFVGDAFGVRLISLRHTHCPDRVTSCASSMGSIEICFCGGGDYRPK